MSSSLFLGFDTSNYTTSVSVVDGQGAVLLNGKRLLSVKEGDRGLRQSDAVFQHVKNLPAVETSLRSALDGMDRGSIAAIGVSVSPRDAEGSYMPCFLPGIAAAETAGAVLGIPVFRFSHQAGHIMAALHSAGVDELAEGSFAAFHVSGGTTDVLFVRPDEEHVFSVERIGGTKDINAGQLIDRIGVLMGLRFPAGPEMEKLAAGFHGGLPQIKTTVDGLECNLSGIENRASSLFEETHDPALVSSYVLETVAKTLSGLRDGIRAGFGMIPILYAGGVMSCRRIKEALSDSNAYFSAPEFSSDNAAGAALLARFRQMKRGE